MKESTRRLLLPALLVLAIGRLWLMPLASSFWVDEMGTLFVVRHGANDVSLRAVPQVPASIYYLLPRLSERVFGSSEIALRLPSVLALALALYLIARIGGRLIHADAGWFAAFACLALRGFDYQAADARPYALGTLMAAAAFWFLTCWLDRGRWRDALWFTLPAVLLWRIHLVYWPMYAAFAFYAVVRLWCADTRVDGRRVVAVFAVCGLALLPVLLRALAVYGTAGAHVIAALPSGMDLLRSFKPGLVASCGAGALLLNLATHQRLKPHMTSASNASLILGWWLLQPVSIFGFSWATSHSVFVHRYVDIALPGAALAATAAAAAFLPPARWRMIAAMLGAAVLLLVGEWNHVWPVHHESGWRAAAQQLNAFGPALPAVCPSPFIEATPPVWRPGVPSSGFLYSHLEAYPVQGNLFAFPYSVSPEAQQYASALVHATLAHTQRFAIYGTTYVLPAWRAWFGVCPELAGWQSRRLGPFGDVDVILFEHTPPRP